MNEGGRWVCGEKCLCVSSGGWKTTAVVIYTLLLRENYSGLYREIERKKENNKGREKRDGYNERNTQKIKNQILIYK